MGEVEKRYRAAIFIRGAQTEYVYGTKIPSLKVRATAKLTTWKPGEGSLFPSRFEIQEQLRVISRRRADWKTIETVRYEDIPEDQLDWKKRKAARTAPV